jgi:Cu(I)/Ag(I) efflux system membrane protein CusA/SilA
MKGRCSICRRLCRGFPCEAADLLQMQDRIIKSFPEVESVFGKAGRASTATDPAPTEMYETVINLKPKDKWRPGMTATPVGVKVFGTDLGEMERVARQIERVLKTVPGTSSAYAERVIGGYYLNIAANREALARYGLMEGDVQETVATALGGPGDHHHC